MADKARQIHTKTGLVALFFLVATGMAFVSGCERSLPETKISGATMGTTYHITLVNTPNPTTPAVLKGSIDTQLKLLNKTFSTYLADSELSQLNATPPGHWRTVSPDLFLVIDLTIPVSEQTHGAYDVTVGPLVNLWGFGKADVMAGIPPEQSSLERARSRVCYQCIELNKSSLRIRKSADIEIDLSSIAKGYAVDKVAETLDQHGIGNYMVEIGGEVVTKGLNAQRQPWLLGIESPQPTFPGIEKKELQQVIHVSNKGVATSGDYRNFVMINGKMRSHIIDPFTGYPVEHNPASVTVIADNCALADAWATAFTVLGPENSLPIADSIGVAAYFVSRNEDHTFNTMMTDSFKAYLAKP